MSDDGVVCPSCGEESPSRAKFCMGCGVALAQEPPSGLRRQRDPKLVGERRVVTVLFADLSGFTSFSEQADPEEVRALADEAAIGLGEIVERYGGAVDKIIGDCVMAVFGAPVAHEDDPERAVRAALDMQAYVTEHSERFARLPLRIGVNTGEAMFAPVGPQGQYTVIGDTVNTAARLQSAAPRGGTLVGAATYAAAADAIEMVQVESITAKGKEEPVPAWQAVAVKGAPRRRAERRVPLVGRTAELDRMIELWERARTERRRYLVSVLGDPGIGKSRLVSELLLRVDRAARVFRGHCLPYGEGITYWPVIEIVKDAADIMQDEDTATTSRKLGTLLERLGSEDMDELRTMAAALANLVAAPTTPRGTYSATQITQAELHWGIRRVFELLAVREPLVIVFEDLHWAEPTLLELLDFMREGSAAGALLVVCVARPEFRDAAPPALLGAPNARLISLDALGERETETLIAELAGLHEMPAGPVGELLRRAAGNPLFLEETVRMLRDAGALDERGQLSPDAASRASDIPTNLRALISSRLDRLEPADARAAQHASVVGGVFWAGAIRYLDEECGDLEHSLATLQERDFVRARAESSIAGEREFAFKHILIRDVAYERLPKTRRAELHARLGRWITGIPGGGDEFIEIVAYHLEQSCRLAREVARTAIEPPVLAAVDALTRAAEKAEGREGIREAERFYARALELVGDRFPETGLELWLGRARNQAALGAPEDAGARLTEVADRAAQIGRSDLRCSALLGLANAEQALARVSEARGHLTEAAELARELGDVRLQVRARLELGSLRAHFEGATEAALSELRDGIRMAADAGFHDLLLEGHLRLGSHLSNIGALADAEQEFTRCVELASQQGTLRMQAAATFTLGFVKFYRGPREEAEAFLRRADPWLERTADRYIYIQNLRTLAKLALARGDPRAGEDRLRQAMPLAMSTGGWLAVDVCRYLVETLVRTERIAEAGDIVEQAREVLPEEDDYSHAAVAIAEALVAAGRDDHAGARAAFERAIARMEGRDGLALDLGEARLGFARILIAAGDDAGAHEQLTSARAIFEPMHANAMLDEIDDVARTMERVG